MKRPFLFIMLGLTFLAGTTGCYRMPTEDDYSLVPTTNNPDLTRDKGNTLLPTMGY